MKRWTEVMAPSLSKRSLKIAGAIALGVTLAVGLFGKLSPSKATLTPPSKPAVFVKEIKFSDLPEEYQYPARVVSETQANLLSEVEGNVTRLLVHPGSPVKKGQALMLIQNPDPLYQYAPYRVTAPTSGVLSSIEVTEGTQISRGSKLATVTDPKRLKVVVEIPSRDADLFKSQIKGRFSSAGSAADSSGALSDALPITLRSLSPWADPATGTSTAEFLFSPKDSSSSQKPPRLSLMPGALGQVRVSVSQKPLLLIPENAVIYRLEKTFVRVVENGKSHSREVTLGKHVRGQVEVQTGLKEGQIVIERTSRFLSDGEEVDVQKSSG